MIEINDISKVFRTSEVETVALNHVNLEVKEGEFAAIMGPSGCGKSTLLNILGLLDNPTEGSYKLLGQEVGNLKEKERTRVRKGKLGFVFQSFNLIDELNVYENVELPLTYLGIRASERRRMVEDILKRMNISHRAKHFPQQLSGGQQQRVGVARALAADPQVLLMDEPFGALDPVTRGALQQEMTRIHRLLGRTIVLVTHDIDEALRLAEHLVLMDHGEVVQQGNPLTMLTRPANDFVRQFFGHSELGVRLLSLRSVADYVRREERAEGEALAEEMTLRDALSLFVARGCEVLPVVNTQGQPCGTLHFQDLLVEA